VTLLFLVVVFSYILGSIPTGYWVGMALKGIDVRKEGSKSTGATNVLRLVGKGPALFVLAVDVLKGYIPVALAAAMENGQVTLALNLDSQIASLHVLAPAAALAALIGHSKSLFLGFSGGKSAATGLGTLLGLNAACAGATLSIWLLVLAASKIVSLASIIAVCTTPLWMWLFHPGAPQTPATYIAYAFLALFYVTLRHKANIGRLLKGTEPKIGQKAKEASSGEQ
jgi:glycerol-3-phosphate acyltransferase PlsY